MTDLENPAITGIRMYRGGKTGGNRFTKEEIEKKIVADIKIAHDAGMDIAILRNPPGNPISYESYEIDAGASYSDDRPGWVIHPKPSKTE